jgi:enolase
MATIAAVRGREILDSRGNPTVEVWMRLDDGTEATAGVPSGASTGKFEAVELRDKNPNRYHGLGVELAVDNVNTKLAAVVIGRDPSDQLGLDQVMIGLDGTENKSLLGANAILGISLAAARGAAISQGIPLYRYIEKLSGKTISSHFPIPMFNVLNGGKHSDSGLSIQEFKIVPYGVASYKEQYRAGSEIFHTLKKILEKDNLSVGVGDEGGFAPHLESHAQALELLNQAILEAGYAPGEAVGIGLDVAANSFYEESEQCYALKPEGVSLSKESLINLYREWIGKYHIVSVEDGLGEEDWSGWAMMKDKLEKETPSWKEKVMLIGDDLLVTNVKRVEKAIDMKSCNAVLIKVNQIGTLSETLACMKLARENGMKTVISHRSGETTDDFIADLAVGASADFIKTGSLSRGERITKYNRLLKIAEELGEGR